MEIKDYVLGSLPSVGPIFGVPTTSLEARVPPLTPSFLPSLTIDWVEVGHNGDRGVCFGVPTTCGGKFWDAHQHCWAKGPSQLAPSHSPCSLSLPSCFLSLPLTPNGQCRVGVCYTMFLGPHHLCGGKGQEGVRGSKREWGEQEGVRGSDGSKREQGRVRGSKESKAPESDWRPKAAKGLWRLPSLP